MSEINGHPVTAPPDATQRLAAAAMPAINAALNAEVRNGTPASDLAVAVINLSCSMLAHLVVMGDDPGQRPTLLAALRGQFGHTLTAMVREADKRKATPTTAQPPKDAT